MEKERERIEFCLLQTLLSVSELGIFEAIFISHSFKSFYCNLLFPFFGINYYYFVHLFKVAKGTIIHNFMRNSGIPFYKNIEHFNT